MDFEPSDEQAMLREVSRSALRSRASSQHVRAAAGAWRDTGLWRTGTDLGWPGLAVPEDLGGAGQGLAELIVVAEELGRAVAPGPFVSSAVVAAALAGGSTDERSRKALDGLVDGTTAAAWALAEPRGAWRPKTVRSRVVRDGDDYLLNGHKSAVQDADSADWVLVTALLDAAPVSFLVERDAPGVSVRRQQVLDLSRTFHTVTLENVRVPSAGLVANESLTGRLSDAVVVLTAADALGAAERLLEMTLDHVKTRHQFGRAIGSFQAVKHKCADMLMNIRAARAAVSYAAMAWDARGHDAALAADVAKAFTSETMGRIAGEALQSHGGTGFTWEHDLHLYLRRIKTDEVLAGDASAHQERICAALLDERAAA